MKTSTAETAKRNPTSHAFRLGIGFVDFGGEPKLRNGLRAAAPVTAPNAAVSSVHRLKSPQGAVIDMCWNGASWEPLSTSGNRLAYTPSYLGRARWTYEGPK